MHWVAPPSADSRLYSYRPRHGYTLLRDCLLAGLHSAEPMYWTWAWSCLPPVSCTRHKEYPAFHPPLEYGLRQLRWPCRRHRLHSHAAATAPSIYLPLAIRAMILVALVFAVVALASILLCRPYRLRGLLRGL